MVQIHLKFESVFTWLLRGVCHRNSIGPKTCGPQTFRVSGYTQGYEKKSTFKSDPFTKVSFEFGLPSQLFHHVEFLDQGWVFKAPPTHTHTQKKRPWRRAEYQAVGADRLSTDSYVCTIITSTPTVLTC